MSLMGELMNMRTMGESGRLDYAIREVDGIKAQFELLVRLLEEKGILTRDEVARLLAPADEVATELPPAAD
jgi:hypothetical protein